MGRDGEGVGYYNYYSICVNVVAFLVKV
jgi:hypothetical protein